VWCTPSDASTSNGGCDSDRRYQVLGNFNMDISRRLGILVFMGVPAIIGGGIVYAIFGSMMPMWIYEVLLLVTAGALVSR
jgi:zinc transporter ZupT